MRANIPAICLLDRLLDTIWPRTCEICAGAVDRPSRHICSDCLNRIPFAPVNGCCRRCSRAAEGLDGEYICEECRATRPSFDRAASAIKYDDVAKKLVAAFKFNGHFWLKKDFVDWLEGVAKARLRVEEVDIVIPMPATLFRRWNRGYNQSALLARALAKRLDKRYGRFVLRRKGSPRPQRGLSEEERRKNAVGTFETVVKKAILDQTVLVVDDVMTTGATFSECAAELKRAGAARVWCVSLARSLR